MSERVSTNAGPFDEVVERRGTDSIKWSRHGEDVLPLWVADMDFRSAPAIKEALAKRVEHGVFGYGVEPADLSAAARDRMARLFGWNIEPEDLLYLPGVVIGFNLASVAFAAPGEGVLIQPPVYHPFFAIGPNTGRTVQTAPLVRRADGGYEVDFDRFERAITPRTRVFVLCNPHNPVGRVFTKPELERMAEICLRHDVVICSDEIHEDFVYSGFTHIPIASIAPEIAAKTVTLFSPSKSFNIAGFQLAVAHASDAALLERLRRATSGLVPHRPGLFDIVAAQAAYQEGGEWLAGCVRYLEGNRDLLVDFVESRLPGVEMFRPEGTYLAWLDCRKAGLGEPPGEFFLREAKVALNEGTIFGKESGQDFVRLNFGCPRSILLEALERMSVALERKVS